MEGLLAPTPGGHGVVGLGGRGSFEPNKDKKKKKRINTPKTTESVDVIMEGLLALTVVCAGRSWRHGPVCAMAKPCVRCGVALTVSSGP